MTKTKRTQKEIDELVLAQADDDSAWEPETRVHPRRLWRLKPSRIELAAKFFVLSALHRMDAHVAWTWGERDADIAVINKWGHTATIEVKALTGSTRWRVENIHPRENHFIVFVCFVDNLMNPQIPPEVYVLPSATLRNALVHTRDSEVLLSELGAELKAREAWHYLLQPQPAA